jgi:hypothetical protein
MRGGAAPQYLNVYLWGLQTRFKWAVPAPLIPLGFNPDVVKTYILTAGKTAKEALL